MITRLEGQQAGANDLALAVPPIAKLGHRCEGELALLLVLLLVDGRLFLVRATGVAGFKRGRVLGIGPSFSSPGGNAPAARASTAVDAMIVIGFMLRKLVVWTPFAI